MKIEIKGDSHPELIRVKTDKDKYIYRINTIMRNINNLIIGGGY